MHIKSDGGEIGVYLCPEEPNANSENDPNKSKPASKSPVKSKCHTSVLVTVLFF